MSDTQKQKRVDIGGQAVMEGVMMKAPDAIAVAVRRPDKTIVVRVDVVKVHPTYKKVIRRSTKFHAHDERNEAKPGDVVRCEIDGLGAIEGVMEAEA